MTATFEDLRFFDNNNAVFYARQCRLFVRELLAIGNFHLARKVATSTRRRNRHLSQEPSVVEFNRLHRALETYLHGGPIAEPEPFRIKPVYKPTTEKEEELMRLELEIRQWQIKCAEEAAEQRFLNMYAASGCIRIGEMSKNGERETWLLGRFGPADPPPPPPASI